MVEDDLPGREQDQFIEGGWRNVLGDRPPTPDNYAAAVRESFCVIVNVTWPADVPETAQAPSNSSRRRSPKDTRSAKFSPSPSGMVSRMIRSLRVLSPGPLKRRTRHGSEEAKEEVRAEEEIARALECPVGTVRSRLHRGRKMLQKTLWEVAEEAGVIHPSQAADL